MLKINFLLRIIPFLLLCLNLNAQDRKVHAIKHTNEINPGNKFHTFIYSNPQQGVISSNIPTYEFKQGRVGFGFDLNSQFPIDDWYFIVLKEDIVYESFSWDYLDSSGVYNISEHIVNRNNGKPSNTVLTYDYDNQLSTKYIYYYNQANLLSSIVSINIDSNTIDQIYDYRYDNSDREISFKMSIYDDSQNIKGYENDSIIYNALGQVSGHFHESVIVNNGVNDSDILFLEYIYNSYFD
ncbi:MAG: hypothetical protein ACI9G9_001038 [Psychromonas sp.]|jgi:hypothetical protein